MHDDQHGIQRDIVVGAVSLTISATSAAESKRIACHTDPPKIADLVNHGDALGPSGRRTARLS
jgi:hypothetical protein